LFSAEQFSDHAHTEKLTKSCTVNSAKVHLEIASWSCCTLKLRAGDSIARFWQDCLVDFKKINVGNYKPGQKILENKSNIIQTCFKLEKDYQYHREKHCL
jgi:hypothetical protein